MQTLPSGLDAAEQLALGVGNPDFLLAHELRRFFEITAPFESEQMFRKNEERLREQASQYLKLASLHDLERNAMTLAQTYGEETIRTFLDEHGKQLEEDRRVVQRATEDAMQRVYNSWTQEQQDAFRKCVRERVQPDKQGPGLSSRTKALLAAAPLGAVALIGFLQSRQGSLPGTATTTTTTTTTSSSFPTSPPSTTATALSTSPTATASTATTATTTATTSTATVPMTSTLTAGSPEAELPATQEPKVEASGLAPAASLSSEASLAQTALSTLPTDAYASWNRLATLLNIDPQPFNVSSLYEPLKQANEDMDEPLAAFVKDYSSRMQHDQFSLNEVNELLTIAQQKNFTQSVGALQELQAAAPSAADLLVSQQGKGGDVASLSVVDPSMIPLPEEKEEIKAELPESPEDRLVQKLEEAIQQSENADPRDYRQLDESFSSLLNNNAQKLQGDAFELLLRRLWVSLNAKRQGATSNFRKTRAAINDILTARSTNLQGEKARLEVEAARAAGTP